MERLASLISGGGTTMEQIVKAAQSGDIPSMEIACIISSTAEAGGMEKARRLGIHDADIVIVDPREFRTEGSRMDRAAFGERLLAVLHDHGATVITQNGWLPLTPSNVIAEYQGRIFNQHPGPPEDFGGEGMYGRRVHAAVLYFRRRTKRDLWTEVIAQHVHEKFDEGGVVKAERVPILPGDTVDELQKRCLPAEHRVQIALLQDVAHGTLELLRRERIVQAQEKDMLEEAKVAARLLYPKG